eukprot:scaffold293340_cov43-Prasinocladus_malaysianus.AAC.2
MPHCGLRCGQFTYVQLRYGTATAMNLLLSLCNSPPLLNLSSRETIQANLEDPGSSEQVVA